MRTMPLLASLALVVVAGCGSSSSNSHSTTPTATAATAPSKSFTDHNSGVSFRYPASWQPHAGAIETLAGIKTYVIRVGVPGNAAGPEITIAGAKSPLPGFPNGQVRVDPSLGPGKFQYFHVTVAGAKGMQVKHILTSGLNEIHTFFESGHSLYDVRIIAANPPLSASLLAGYNTMLSSVHVK